MTGATVSRNAVTLATNPGSGGPGGGGIYIAGGSKVTLTDVKVNHNTVTALSNKDGAGGGGIMIGLNGTGGEVTITGASEINSNVVTVGTGKASGIHCGGGGIL